MVWSNRVFVVVKSLPEFLRLPPHDKPRYVIMQLFLIFRQIKAGIVMQISARVPHYMALRCYVDELIVRGHEKQVHSDIEIRTLLGEVLAKLRILRFQKCGDVELFVVVLCVVARVFAIHQLTDAKSGQRAHEQHY